MTDSHNDIVKLKTTRMSNICSQECEANFNRVYMYSCSYDNERWIKTCLVESMYH